MLIELFIAARVNDAANSLRRLEPNDANERTAEAVERGLERLYYRIHKKRIEKEQLNGKVSKADDDDDEIECSATQRVDLTAPGKQLYLGHTVRKGNKMSTVAQVSAIPNCDICASSVAKYDGMTSGGPWAYMCQQCFDNHGVGLGLGKGQELVLCK